MTADSPLAPAARPADCARYDAQLEAWLEGALDSDALDSDARAFMTAHRATCAACAALTRDLEQIVAEAAALPSLSPPRDLWAGIAERIPPEIVSWPAAMEQPTAVTGWSWRRLSAVAAALVVVTAGVTWQLASRPSDAVRADRTDTAVAAAVGAAPAMPAADRSLVMPTGERVVGSPDAAAARVVDRGPAAPDVTYEREIAAMRRLVDERFAELDPHTVAELRRNLAIIDQAIADTRRALARDPGSAFGARQLDRALQAKLDLMRKVVLL